MGYYRFMSKLTLMLLGLSVFAVHAQDKVYEERLGAGDMVRVQVYQNPDLSLETRVLETGDISYPLIGRAHLAGLTIPTAEQLITNALKSGGYLLKPQVTITLLQPRRKQVSVLGMVGRPGLVPLEYVDTKLSDVLAEAGGIAPTGSDVAVVTGQRDGKPIRLEVDIASMYLSGKAGRDVTLAPGDVVYVHRAPVVYVYGEAQHPGAFRLEPNMTVTQALVLAGGPTARGTERRLVLRRQNEKGETVELSPGANDPVQANDVIFVRESLF